MPSPTMKNLASQLKLLSISPVWGIVQNTREVLLRERDDDAFQALLKKDPDDLDEKDQARLEAFRAQLSTLQTYIDRFAVFSRPMAQALLIGAAIAESYAEGDERSDSPSERLYRATDLLRKRLGLSAAHGAEDLQERIDGFLERSTLLNEIISPGLQLESFDPRAAEKWESDFLERLGVVRAAASQAREKTLKEAEERLSTVWPERLTAFILNGKKTFPPADSDLIGEAAELFPTRLLSPKLAEMTIKDWSDLFLLPLLDEKRFHGLPSGWIYPAAAAHRLNLHWIFGLSPKDPTPGPAVFHLMETIRSGVDQDREKGAEGIVTFLAERAEASSDFPMVVILRSPGPGLTERWKPLAKVQAISFGWEQEQSDLVLDSFIGHFQSYLTIRPGLDPLLIFLDGPLPESLRGFADIMGQRFEHGVSVFYLVKKTDPDLAPPEQQIVRPRGLSGAVKMARAVEQRRS